MDTDVEPHSWFLASSHYSREMAQLFQNVLGCLIRMPGLDDLTRTYLVTLNYLGYEVLGDTLLRHFNKVWPVRHTYNSWLLFRAE